MILHNHHYRRVDHSLVDSLLNLSPKMCKKTPTAPNPEHKLPAKK